MGAPPQAVVGGPEKAHETCGAVPFNDLIALLFSGFNEVDGLFQQSLLIFS